MRAPVKYYGGKTKMLPHILPLIPKHRVYLESFAGGASLFWAKPPSPVEVLNDINENVANFYRVMKTQFQSLDILIQSTLHCEATFNRAKSIYRSSNYKNEVERAWAFYVCAIMSFGGEVGGSFQWVKNKNDNWHPAVAIANRRKEFQVYEGRLDKVSIRDKLAEQLIPCMDSPELFVYADPPYVGARQGHYSGYTQEQFEALLDELSVMEGKFLMSSYPNDALSAFVKENGWNQREISMRLGITGNQQRKTEVLTWNYELEKKAPTLFSELNDHF
ncbi:DNA adenine methylase [uncultured Algoriphagus sp.]|uniref:DNA adenine methylase n=1 Tax=uncultured Algoriphagus sp. TaxID=417365 RepID=UPI00259911C9|nr:DNA adenine methylase [uncultured Algoriphagus sp.]